MKESIGFYLFALIIIISPFLIVGSIIKVFNDAADEQAWIESKLNTKYILNKDTFTIIDYSNLRTTFILSNGIEINQNLVK